MDIKEVLKLKDGTKVKLFNGDDDEIWVVSNGTTLILKDTSCCIEDRYVLGFIVNTRFERCYEEEDYEKLTIDEILCENRVGHRIRRVSDDLTVYRVIEENQDSFDLESLGVPIRISDKYFLSTIINSLYIDLEEFEEDFSSEE